MDTEIEEKCSKNRANRLKENPQMANNTEHNGLQKVCNVLFALIVNITCKSL